MEGTLNRYLGITLLVLVTLVLEVFSKSVSHVKEDLFPTSYRCSCKVEVQTSNRGVLSHDYGLIHTYDDPWNSCKDARRRCRDECQERAQLDKYVTDVHVDNHDKLGYTLCKKYGMPTYDGALEMEILASVAECPGHKPIKAKHDQICCGLTPVPLNDQKAVYALGWNKDCVGVAYVV